MYMCVYIYIYIYMTMLLSNPHVRKAPGRDKRAGETLRILITPSPPTKSFDFRGFDSSRRLILRGGSSHVRIIL